MSNDANVSLNELYAAAIEAEKKGVPVSWKDMFMQGITLANNYIAPLEQENARLKQELNIRDQGKQDG